MDEDRSVLFRLPSEYEAWVAYVFDPPGTEPVYWFWGGDYERALVLAAERTLNNVLRLFGSNSQLLERYSVKQIDEGFWRIVHFLDDWIDSQYLPLPTKLRILALVPIVFEDTLGKVACDTCYTGYMWWDCLRFVAGRTPQLLPAMRKAMLTMLHSEAETVIASAVHGLGHLVGDLGDQPARQALVSLLDDPQVKLPPQLRRDVELAVEGRTP